MTLLSDIAGTEVAGIGLGGPLPDADVHGEKAAWLGAAAAAGLPVPPGFAIPPGAVPAVDDWLARLDAPGRPLLLSVRASAPGAARDFAPAVLNIGLDSETRPAFEDWLGPRGVADLARRQLQSWGCGVGGIHAEEFEYALFDALKAAGKDDETELDAAELEALAETFAAIIADEDAPPLPARWQDQLAGALEALPERWHGAARRRAARGEDAEAPVALIVQRMVLGVAPGLSGAGVAQTRNEASGERRLSGRWLPGAQGEEALLGLRTPRLVDGECGFAAALEEAGAAAEAALTDAASLEFTVEDGTLWVLALRPLRASARGTVRIAVDLAAEGVIPRDEALLRVDPRLLDEHLHPTIDRNAPRDRIGRGLAASPGAASGQLVFSAEAAEASAARGIPSILARIETSPEDIRGMHAATGVVTVRGGMTSHAAVVARGLGTPCVVGASDLLLDLDAGVLKAGDGRRFEAGNVITVDGGNGDVLAGRVEMVQPELTGAFATLMDWADDARRMGVRANADTPLDVDVARQFRAEGIGLCRTEHMFFEAGRIAAMREMILAESSADRQAALAKLLPVQREDLRALFRAMEGRPVMVRLLDPPLHEFLPHGQAELAELARAMDISIDTVLKRAEGLAEFNPMLGKRGCRIGIAYPEIYEMQARAIFEAACEAGAETGDGVRPEIMIPLVSAKREAEVLTALIDRVAAEVRAERGRMVEYDVGVMIETPRAALRAGDIARGISFLSFGTNDLTQMAYGLSRDDAGRFMRDYLALDVFDHDPFHTLDVDGVGELLLIAARRARAEKPDISLGICGEHGGDPASILFCERAGFDYISCSPYRVPIARLAAAQATIVEARRKEGAA